MGKCSLHPRAADLPCQFAAATLAAMRYEMISADCHLDLCWLPPDLFTSKASAALKERMPYTKEGPRGPAWVTNKGASLGLACGMGSAGREYIPGRIHRSDRMASTGLYEDGKRGIRRVTDPELRLKDQDRDGVQAEVLYGVLGTTGRMNDPGATVELSVARSAFASNISQFQMNMSNILTSMIFSGVFERYPRMKLVLGESGIGWIPYVLWRMDAEWEDQFKDLSLTMPPSEYWKRQCWATYQTDPIGVKLIEELGEDKVMWGSDFPHPDGVWPDSREYIDRELGHLAPGGRRKIVCENAGKLYGLIR